MATTLDAGLALQPLPQHIIEGISNLWQTDATFEKFLTCIGKHVGADITRTSIKLSKNPCRKINRAPPQHKKKLLTHHERRRLGLHTIGKNEATFQQMLIVHNLWLDYMRNLLNLKQLKASGWKNSPEDPSFEMVSVKLYRADYHGAFMTVAQSKCSSLIGVTGIVAMETKNCLRLIGEDNKCRTIPKQDSMFLFRIDDFQFTFLGKHFLVRPAERSNRKIKNIRPTSR